MIVDKHPYVVIAGPTASGKSGLGIRLAKELGGDIVNFDSVQVYRGFDIGAAKPTRDEMSEVPHHLFDIVEPHEEYDARKFSQDALEVMRGIWTRKRIPILVGGTGLYLRALWGEQFHEDMPKDQELRDQLEKRSNPELMKELQRIDPERARKIHLNDRFRLVRAVELAILLGGPAFARETSGGERGQGFVIILDPDRGVLHQRIAERSKMMLEAGLLEEVQRLLDAGVPQTVKPFGSIGYKQCLEAINDGISSDALLEKIKAATRQYAKRQTTWFKKVSCQLRLTDACQLEEHQESLRRHVAELQKS